MNLYLVTNQMIPPTVSDRHIYVFADNPGTAVSGATMLLEWDEEALINVEFITKAESILGDRK